MNFESGNSIPAAITICIKERLCDDCKAKFISLINVVKILLFVITR